jgi:bacillithiol system protein YtxJ
MFWSALNNLAQLDAIRAQSELQPIVLFKHSTRCSISSIAKSRLERESVAKDIPFYLLDLLNHRDISQALAEQFSVFHESPQVLLIYKGECVYDESHNGITMSAINEQLTQF